MPHRRLLAALAVLSLAVAPAGAADDVGALIRELRSVGPQGSGSAAARAAWVKLVARGPAVLPQLLAAMDTPDTVAANWLRTAFDRIADADLRDGGKHIDADALLAFVRDAKHQGRVRRLALDLVERLRPGTRDRLIPGWIDDPEFRYEAVAALAAEGDARLKAGDKGQAVARYRKAFAAAQDMAQAAALAAKLKDQGTAVSVHDHMGFLRDWYVVGPFDAGGMKGFRTVYPPEEKIDLGAEYSGKDGRKVRWQRYHVEEPPPAAADFRSALVNLDRALGTNFDAVAYAYTEVRLPEAREVEFRGAADDNFTVWVNGRKVFGFEEYRNGVRLDRHRFRVPLRAGVNTVLVKVCQAPLDPASREPNWEFLLRAVDSAGNGVLLPGALPAAR